MLKNKINPAKYGLNFKIWQYFVLLIIFIAILMWLLQIVFFNNFYLKYKERELINIGNTLKQEYESENFQGNIYRKTNYGSMPVRIFNKEGISVLSSSILELSNPDPIDIILFTEPLLNSSKNTISKVVDNPSVEGSEYMVYGILLKEGKVENENIYLYVFSQLASMDNTASVLKEQLVIITMVSLTFAILLSYFISYKLVKPISHLTDTAELLAQGNYDITFQGGVYTEADKLADALNYATNELLKTDKLRRELISNVSHELRTPLTVIKAYAEMIRDLSGSNAAKREAHVNVIINESNRLTDLVNDILDISKFESGTTEMVFSEVNLTELTNTIVNMFSDMYTKDGYNFISECDKDVFAEVDEKKFKQVLYNLIINAINYTGDDKMVYLSLKDMVHRIRFEITDSGNGIPAGQADKIWDRYYRLSESKNRPTKGTGLGLSIVKSILKLHNADFGIDSIEGKGCTVWFEIKKEK
ncbi:MAG: sensor histidine kinase [Sedimentibacter sp.]